MSSDASKKSGKATGSKDNAVQLQRNEKGGILITPDELKVAWDFFDTNDKKKLTTLDIKRRLQTFYKDITAREVKFLLNNEPEITFDDLYKLLKDNQLTNFDPVKEAFKVYDPNNTGFVDMDMVKYFFKELGYGEISDEDAKIILETADGDKDGRIGLDDFRMMVPFGQPADDQPAGSAD
mmetsp:Transcript_97819/g.174241  ORF Transcript_97819/g.174241 Transcript_97819/m.174241 type:complete len:180 (+) Transcript_97819:70-609(+)|eukprot:CAMPEP_0197650158 /NCGR_PEP_ID=MMETSP1338-20131121/30776_1 /TAXON_ID=43686 ORGANISM="Pelagodinium beii, Strain RCC1491" /NCGR_SAMPLE_ID=MMETSP1338 /ASSEMBLY_ACC=CAM_ASM_000754 /LENGTH=179 /DNA_ID=CAMNT_0043224511 /DNA_START=70 /DNA_END=609 /DNA_ORIENTATION=+